MLRAKVNGSRGLKSMLFGAVALAITPAASPAAAAVQIAGVSIFASGAAVVGTSPDSITVANGSVWVEYGNGVDSTGVIPGNSTIVQYGASGAIRHTYSIAGSVDGLKVNPTTSAVWALQNQDGNATLSLINPSTGVVTGPLKYAAPPYVYGPNSGRGYDDVAFLGGQVFLSYTNPASPTDPVLQRLDQGDNPSGTLTTTTILTAQQTGILSPDIDSLKSTPSGQLVLTSEGDGTATTGPAITLITNPGAVNQSVTNIDVTDGAGDPVQGMDDVLFPGATSGTLYVADSGTDRVYAVRLRGLDPNTPIVSLGGLGEVALVSLNDGIATPLLTGADVPGGTLTGPHGLDFVAGVVPEPATWAMMLLGFGGLGAAVRMRRRLAAA